MKFASSTLCWKSSIIRELLWKDGGVNKRIEGWGTWVSLVCTVVLQLNPYTKFCGSALKEVEEVLIRDLRDKKLKKELGVKKKFCHIYVRYNNLTPFTKFSGQWWSQEAEKQWMKRGGVLCSMAQKMSNFLILLSFEVLFQKLIIW